MDEDLPRSTARILKNEGYDVVDVRDCGLRGRPDQDVFAFAQQHNSVLITGDMGFANITHFRIGEHSGIIVVRCPNEMPPVETNRQIVEAFNHLTESDFKGNLIILDPGRVRIRRK